MNLTPFSEISIASVSVTLLVIAVVQKLKVWFPKIDPELLSVVLGAIFGAMALLYSFGIPSNLQEVILSLFYVIAAAFMPSGTYEVFNPRGE